MTEEVDPESLQKLKEMYTILGVNQPWWRKVSSFACCGRWSITEAAEVLLYAVLGTTVSLVLGLESRDGEVKKDTQRYPLAVLTCIGGPLTAFIGLFYMKVRSTVSRGLLVFLFLWLIPLVILLAFLYAQKYDLVALVILAYCPACVTYFSALHSVRTRLHYATGRTFASAISMSICALGPFWGCCFALFEIVSTANITIDLLARFVAVLAVPFLLCLILAWSYLHFVFFVKYESAQEEQAQEVRKSIPSLAMQLAIKENPSYFDPPPPGCWTSFQSKAHLFSSILQLCTLLGIEIGLLSLLVRYADGSETASVLYVAAFYIPALPFFTYLGIIFSGCSLQVSDKYWSGALLGVAVPLLCIYPATHWLNDQGVTDVLAWIISISYPASIVYWLSMSLLYEHDKRSYQLFSAFMCLTVLVPVGVLIPLYEVGGIKLSTFWSVFCILCVLGVSLVSLLWLANFVRNFSVERYRILIWLKTLDGHKVSLWVYTTAFVIGYSIVTWTFFWKVSNREWSPGMLLGCVLGLIFMAICSYLTHRIKVYARVIGREEDDLSEILIHRQRLSKTDTRMTKRVRRYQKVLPIAGLVFLLVVIIPMLAVSGLADEEVAASITVLILILLTVALTVALIDAKWKLRQYGPRFISFLLACCWCMVILPLVCLVPTTLAISGNSKDLQVISSWTIGFTCILCMLGVSSVSILVNYVFKRMEYEKLAKYCCRRLQKLMRSEGVFCSMPLLRIAFDHFYYSTEAAFEAVLSEATYITHRVLSGSDKPRYFSKQLLTVEELAHFSALRRDSDSNELTEDELKRTSKGKRQKRSCKQLLLSLCSTEEQDEIPIFVDQLLPAELGAAGSIPEDHAEIQYVDRPLEQQIAISHSFNPARYGQIFEEAEKQERTTSPQPVKLDAFFGGMVLKAIKTMDKKNTVEKTPEVKDIVAKNRDFLLMKMAEMEAGEPAIANEDLPVTRLKGKERKRLLKSQHFLTLKDDPDKRKEWFKTVHRRFAHGELGRDGETWSQLHDLRQFVRITGLERSPKFVNVAVDIMYVQMTRRFNASRTIKTFQKINFDVFYDDLLKLMAKVKYPSLPLKEAEDKLFEKYIYPNLVYNLPYLGVPDKPKPRQVAGLRLNPLLALMNTQKGEAGKPPTDPNFAGNPPEEAKTTEEGAFHLPFTRNIASREGDPLDIKDLTEEQRLEVQLRMRGVDRTEKWEQIRNKELVHGQTWAGPGVTVDNDLRQEPESRIDNSSSRFAIQTEELHERRREAYVDPYDRCMNKCSEKVTDCIKFIAVLCSLSAKCLFPTDKSAEKFLASVEQIDEETLPLEGKENPDMRKASPDWQTLCHLIASSLTLFLEEGRKVMEGKPIQKMEINSENLMAIFGHVTDVISMSSIAFAKEVGWTNSDSIASHSSRVVLAESPYWTLNYWVCFLLSVLFAVLSVPAIRMAKAGHYGISSDMRPVKALSWPAVLSRAVSLLAVSFYMTIMKTQLDALSCIYDDLDNKWTLIRNSDIQCFSAGHAPYFTLSVLVICIYYPLATLLYPNIQYQNKGLDLKYDTTYVVIEAQGKLAIAGFAAFLPREKYLRMQLIVCICVNWLLGIISAKMKPCLVKSYNLWKSGGSFLVGWCGFWALMNVIAGGATFCLVLLVIGVGVILSILGFLQYRLYGWTFRRRRVRVPDAIEESQPQDQPVDTVRVQPSIEAQAGPANPFRDLLARQGQ